MGVNFFSVKEGDVVIISERNDVRMVRKIRSVRQENSISNLKLINRLQLNIKKSSVYRKEVYHGLVM